ncbi:type IV secretion system protein [Phenylobacterium sp.]|uniref:type IV secretion system protein n=1 Tax=Phenylobacterium sp. TaxID=1871053 RepID=UPI003562F98A
MILRRLLLAGIAALTLTASAAHAQMAVYDATSYAKLIQQAQTALDQLHRAETQVQQGEQLLQSLNQGSNVGAIAQVLEAPALRQLLPGVPALMSAAQGDVAGLGAIGTQAAAIRSANRLYTPPAGDALAADLEAAGMRAARDMALGQAVATGGQQRLTGLQALQQSIDAAPNARAVLDLQARASAEQAMIANDQMRLQGLAMTQAAEDRLQAQRDKERVAAGNAARLALYKSGFQ